ncbi:hypothetical protein [Gramella sp. KN1008]|uniref:hypothetical protein n=1 Tax=Gramella sp. KN1008 TaxID=2529298 RepID=UPI00103CF26D|nr:hypothetical protein [Gramella sp. KN1008]TBW27965.1 hypothetical protein EZJ28_09530 [Gramella sp. KN1008]
MNLTHVLKLAGKFVVRGFIFKAGKKLALKGGKVGIGAGALIAGGYLAYQLLQEREKQQQEEQEVNVLDSDDPDEPIVV